MNHNALPNQSKDVLDVVVDRIHAELIEPIPGTARMVQLAIRQIDETFAKVRVSRTFTRRPDHSFMERNKTGNLFQINPSCALDTFSREEALTLRQELSDLLACEGCGAITEDDHDGYCLLCAQRRTGGWL